MNMVWIWYTCVQWGGKCLWCVCRMLRLWCGYVDEYKSTCMPVHVEARRHPCVPSTFVSFCWNMVCPWPEMTLDQGDMPVHFMGAGLISHHIFILWESWGLSSSPHACAGRTSPTGPSPIRTMVASHHDLGMPCNYFSGSHHLET